MIDLGRVSDRIWIKIFIFIFQRDNKNTYNDIISIIGIKYQNYQSD